MTPQAQRVPCAGLRLEGRRLAVFGLFGAGCLALAFLLDHPARELVRSQLDPDALALARTISVVTDLPFLWMFSLLSAGLGTFFGCSRLRRLAATLALAGTLSGFVGMTIRGVTGRTRPCAATEPGWYGLRKDGRWLVGEPSFNSFPSGHTCAMAGFVGALWILRPKTLWPVWIFPMAVAWARMKLDRHWLSDIVPAFLIGILSAEAVHVSLLRQTEGWIEVIRRRLRRAFQLEPEPGSHYIAPAAKPVDEGAS